VSGQQYSQGSIQFPPASNELAAEVKVSVGIASDVVVCIEQSEQLQQVIMVGWC